MTLRLFDDSLFTNSKYLISDVASVTLLEDL